jgi:hypothetical protein
MITGPCSVIFKLHDRALYRSAAAEVKISSPINFLFIYRLKYTRVRHYKLIDIGALVVSGI